MTASHQTALVAGHHGEYTLINNAQVQAIEPDMILCKVFAVALNPADWKMADFSTSATTNSIGGNDFAGEVVQVGSNVSRFQVGDRVFGFTFGLNPTDKTAGAFAQYVRATADLTAKIPPSMSYQDASTLGLGIATASTALYHMLGLPLPAVDSDSISKKTVESQYVLVSGGATATGTIAIQLLRASGLVPIATCSPGNMDRVKALGAAATFDYNSPTCAMEIRNYTNNTLAYVLDCATDSETMKMCYDAIGLAGGSYVALDPLATHVQYTRRDVKADWVMAYSLWGQAVELTGLYGRRAAPADRQFAANMFRLAQDLLLLGKLSTHPIEVRAGGLQAIPLGIDDLRKGKVRAKKLVYPVA